MGETSKVRQYVGEYVQGFGIDVGCGDDKIRPQAIGLDTIHHPCTTIVRELKDLKLFGDKQFDYVYSSHFLEHLDSPEKMLKEMYRVLKVKGYLVLFIPDKDRYTENNPAHKHMWDVAQFAGMLEKVFGKKMQVEDCLVTDFDYSYLYVLSRVK